MRILHICPSQSYSGLEQYALSLARDQKARGLEIAFVIFPGSPLEQKCLEAGIECVPYLYSSFSGTLSFWARLLKRLKGQHAPDIVHLHMTSDVSSLSWPLFLNRLNRQPPFIRLKRPKVILQIHIWLNHRKKDPLHWLFYRNIDQIWCSSERAKQSLIQQLPVSPSKFRIINYGRDIQAMKPKILDREAARAKLKLSSRSLVAGVVTRIEEGKGVREFVEASLPLLEKHADLELLIIGQPSPNDQKADTYFRDVLKRMKSESQGIQSRVYFPGNIPDSYTVLKAFDLYVLPSYEECFSLSLLDAQLASLPVVGTDSGGTPEIVRVGQTGWLAQPRDWQNLSEKITQALDEKEKWAQYGQNARDRVEREFDTKEIYEQIVEKYRELLQP